MKSGARYMCVYMYRCTYVLIFVVPISTSV